MKRICTSLAAAAVASAETETVDKAAEGFPALVPQLNPSDLHDQLEDLLLRTPPRTPKLRMPNKALIDQIYDQDCEGVTAPSKLHGITIVDQLHETCRESCYQQGNFCLNDRQITLDTSLAACQCVRHPAHPTHSEYMPTTYDEERLPGCYGKFFNAPKNQPIGCDAQGKFKRRPSLEPKNRPKPRQCVCEHA